MKMVQMTDQQYTVAHALLSMTPQQLQNVAAILNRVKDSGMKGLGDYSSWLRDQINPAEGFIKPYGPSNFPVRTKDEPTSVLEGLKQIRDELIRQRTASRPLIRSKAVDQNGATLDWTPNGQMGRLMIRNKGANSVWMAFDIKGQNVDAFTSNNSVEIQSQESWNMELVAFSFIGVRCTSGQSGTVHAIAFPANSGNMAGNVG